jgi:hypothetical protein
MATSPGLAERIGDDLAAVEPKPQYRDGRRLPGLLRGYLRVSDATQLALSASRPSGTRAVR